MIDRITKYGEMTPDSGKLNDDEILRQPIVRNLDNGKYIPLSDANPMTQTIMERVHGSMISLRQNSIFNSNINLRKNSSDTHNLSTSELNLSRKKQFDSSSSDSSSTRSSHTTEASTSSSSVTNKSSRSVRSVKKQLAKLVVMNFLRRNKKTNDKHGDVDDEEDDNERLLINDGSNGDLKYKASRHVKESAQFDKTQLLQTIVNAHDGPIWCMR
jgi:hypothetical protein